MIKRFIIFGIAIVSLPGIRPQSQAQTRIRLATLAPAGTTYHQELLAMGQGWQQQGVKLTVYTDGTQGAEPEIVRRMRIGERPLPVFPLNE